MIEHTLPLAQTKATIEMVGGKFADKNPWKAARGEFRQW